MQPFRKVGDDAVHPEFLHALDVGGFVHGPWKDFQALPVDLGDIPFIEGAEMGVYGHRPQFLGHSNGLQGILAYEYGNLYDPILRSYRPEFVPFKAGNDNVP